MMPSATTSSANLHTVVIAVNDGDELRIYTVANLVTVLRVALIPVFFIVLVAPWPESWGDAAFGANVQAFAGAALFVLLASTDGIDGYLARSRNEITVFGKFMDPIADKILVLSALLALIQLGALPAWVALIILTREFLVSGLRMLAASSGDVIAASGIGKWKTVTTLIAIVLFILKLAPAVSGSVIMRPLVVIAWIMMFVALVLTIVSMVDYIRGSITLFKR